jgi:hypothetical protein
VGNATGTVGDRRLGEAGAMRARPTACALQWQEGFARREASLRIRPPLMQRTGLSTLKASMASETKAKWHVREPGDIAHAHCGSRS